MWPWVVAGGGVGAAGPPPPPPARHRPLGGRPPAGGEVRSMLSTVMFSCAPGRRGRAGGRRRRRHGPSLEVAQAERQRPQQQGHSGAAAAGNSDYACPHTGTSGRMKHTSRGADRGHVPLELWPKFCACWPAQPSIIGIFKKGVRDIRQVSQSSFFPCAWKLVLHHTRGSSAKSHVRRQCRQIRVYQRGVADEHDGEHNKDAPEPAGRFQSRIGASR